MRVAFQRQDAERAEQPIGSRDEDGEDTLELMQMPIFTPDNEPYLGRQSVLQLDHMILVTLEQNEKIGPWTHGKNLTALQQAATELLPHGFSIALSIRAIPGRLESL